MIIGGQPRVSVIPNTMIYGLGDGIVDTAESIITGTVKQSAADAVQPYVIGGLVLCLGSLFLSMSAFLKVRKLERR